MSTFIARLDAGLSGLLEFAARGPVRSAVLVAILALAVIVPGLATMPVTDRDEGRFVQASKQMLETGDLIDIRLQDEPRWKKPAGIYWLQAGSAAVNGSTDAPIWAYRLPSAIAGVLVALLTLWAARPLVGPRAAVLAGGMMALSLLLVVEAHIAKTDAALAVTAIAAFGALSRTMLGHGGRLTALVFWLAIAASILLKGPIVPAICLLALAWWWIIGRQRPKFAALEPLKGIALTVLLVAPWLIAIWVISDGAFFAESLGEDMGAKISAGQEMHWGPPGLYAGIVWGTLWPWAALIPLAIGWWWRERKAIWMVMLAGWVIPFWLLLELVPTKLPHYVLPLYPAIVIGLAAWACSTESNPARWTRIASAALVVLPAIGLALAVLVLPLVLEGIVVWSAVPLALIGGLAGVAAAKSALQGRVLGQIATSAIAALAIYPAVLHFALPSLGTAFPSPRMAALIAQYEPCAEGAPFSIGYHEPSLVFLTRTDIRLAAPEEMMDALANAPGTLVLIEDRWQDILTGGGKLDAVERASITYFNYNRGKMETARLLTADDPRWASCEAG